MNIEANKTRSEIPPIKPEKKGLTKKQKKVMAGIGVGMFLTSAVGGGIAYKTLGQNHPTKTTIETPQKSQEKSPITIEKKKGVYDYAEELKKYDEMSIDDFEKLPRDERLMYGQFIYDKFKKDGFYPGNYAIQPEANQYEVTPVGVSLENTGQEISDQWLHKLQAAGMQTKIDVNKAVFDKSSAVKLLSLDYFQVGSNDHISKNYEYFKSLFTGQFNFEILGDKHNVTDTSQIQEGTTYDGENVKYKDITFVDINGETIHARFIYDEYESYDESIKAAWFYDTGVGNVAELSTYSSVKQP